MSNGDFQTSKNFKRDDVEFTVWMANPFEVLNMEAHLIELGAGPIIRAVAMVTNKNGAALEREAVELVQAFIGIDARKLNAMFRMLLTPELVSVKLPGMPEAERLTDINAERAFKRKGGVMDMHVVMLEVLKMNFSDFIEGLASEYGRVARAGQPPQAPEPLAQE